MIRKTVGRILGSRLVRDQRGTYAVIMLLCFTVLAVPMALAAVQVAGQLSMASRVWDSRLTGYYGAGSGVELAMSEIIRDSSQFVEDEAVEFSWDINNEVIRVTVTRLHEEKYVDVMLTLDSFGGLPILDEDRQLGLKKVAHKVVDTFELYAMDGRIRMGVTRFRNATNDTTCGDDQSIAAVTDRDYHSGDAASYGPNKLHPFYHLDDPLHIPPATHSLTPRVDEPLHDYPPIGGIAALLLHGFDVTFGTNIVKGIRCGVGQYENPLGSDRPNIPNVMILVTDGQDTAGNGPQHFMAEVDKWVAEGRLDEVFAVGIGSAAEVGYPDPNTIDSCNDGIDNGGDGFTDGDDPDCPGAEDGFPNFPPSTCTDGIDNDGDGNKDGQDHDCSLNLNAIALDPAVPDFNLDPVSGDAIVPDPANPYAWDHVFHAQDFEELLDIIGNIVEAVKQAGAVFETPYTVEAVAPGGTILARVVLTADGQIVIVSWDER